MNILVLIQRQSMQVYYPDRDTPIACMVPPAVVRDVEVVNEKELDTVLSGVLRPAPNKSVMPTIILIDDSICFSSFLEVGREEEMKKKLVNDVPFLHIASTVLPLDAGQLFVMTNQDLYESVGRILESHGHTIVGVYPWSAVAHVQAIKSGEGFGPIVIKRLFDAVSDLKHVSFVYHNQVSVPLSSAPADGHAHTKKLPVGWIIFLGLALVYVLVMIWYMFFRAA